MRSILLIGFALLASNTANAQITVLGKGVEHTCFERVVSGSIQTGARKKDIAVCDKALKASHVSHRDRIATYVNRGILLMHSGDYEKSLADLDKAAKMDPDLGNIYINRGATLIFLDRYDEAIADLSKAIELNTSDLHAAYYNRALAYESKDDLNSAYFDLKEALKLNPDFTLAEEQLSYYTIVQH